MNKGGNTGLTSSFVFIQGTRIFYSYFPDSSGISIALYGNQREKSYKDSAEEEGKKMTVYDELVARGLIAQLLFTLALTLRQTAFM